MTVLLVSHPDILVQYFCYGFRTFSIFLYPYDHSYTRRLENTRTFSHVPGIGHRTQDRPMKLFCIVIYHEYVEVYRADALAYVVALFVLLWYTSMARPCLSYTAVFRQRKT